MITIDQAETALAQDLATIRQFVAAQAQIKRYEPAVRQIMERLIGSAVGGTLLQQADTIINNNGGVVVQNTRRSYNFTTEFVQWRSRHFSSRAPRGLHVAPIPKDRRRVWLRYGWIEITEPAGGTVVVTELGWKCR